MGFLDKLQNRIELYRLEKKYIRRANRSTFSTGAVYVNGEYVYDNGTSGVLSASSTGSSSRSGGMNKRMSTLMSRS